MPPISSKARRFGCESSSSRSEGESDFITCVGRNGKGRGEEEVAVEDEGSIHFGASALLGLIECDLRWGDWQGPLIVSVN